jgi:tRNA threonylcarbamoyladenosine biosynthesis protein TsaE
MELKKNFQSKSSVNLFLKDFSNYINAGHCIFLYGDFGVGKTFFSQQIIKSLALVDFISSPTYNIVNTYQYSDNYEIWHCDLYRVNSYDEVLELGILDNLDRKILLVEWPNLLERMIKNPIIFKINFGKTSYERNVMITLPKSLKMIKKI